MHGRNRKGYWWALLLSVALVVVYVQRRDLQGRYEQYLESDADVQELAREVEALDQKVETTRQRVEELKDDPVALEAAIRRWSRKVKEGEIIYRIETPSEPEETP